MGAFGSRGGLLRNAPLKRDSCADKEAQSCSELRQLDKAIIGACQETFSSTATDGVTEKNFCGKGNNR